MSTVKKEREKKRPLSDRSSEENADVELMASVARKDPRSCRIMVDRLLDRTRKTVGYLIGSQNDVDDLSQLSLLEILRSAGSFRGESSLEYWSDRITTRVVAKYIQKKKRRTSLFRKFEGREITQPDLGGMHDTSKIEDLDEKIARDQARNKLTKHLQKLSPDRRIAIALHHVLGYTITEIADLTGVPVNTVRDRLRVGRKQLRKRILSDPELRQWAQKELS